MIHRDPCSDQNDARATAGCASVTSQGLQRKAAEAQRWQIVVCDKSHCKSLQGARRVWQPKESSWFAVMRPAQRVATELGSRS
jgi:hypothetical protein